MTLVWQLCVALWGSPEELEEDIGQLFEERFIDSYLSVVVFLHIFMLMLFVVNKLTVLRTDQFADWEA